MSKRTQQTPGFSLVEVIVVTAIIVIISTARYLSLVGFFGNSSQRLSVDRLVSDIKSQQLQAMMGANLRPQGVYFSVNTSTYTLFECQSQYSCIYDPQNPTNLSVKLETTSTVSEVNLPNSQVVFQPNSGEVQDYDPQHSSISIVNTTTSTTSTLTINKYGTVSIL